MPDINNLGSNAEVDQLISYTADGTDDTTTGEIIDMANHKGVLFIASFGDVDNTAVLTLQAQQDTAAGGGTMATLSGSATFTADATSADNGVLLLEIVDPEERYLRPQVVRATGNAIIGSVTAIRYGARSKPVTQPDDVLDYELLISPAEA